MRAVGMAAGIVALVCVCGVTGLMLHGGGETGVPYDPYASQRAALEWDTVQFLNMLSRVLWSGLLIGLLLGGTIGLGALATAWGLFTRGAVRRQNVIQADARGTIPVDYEWARANPQAALLLLSGAQQVMMEAARASRMPNVTHYNSSRTLMPGPEPAQLPAGPDVPQLPSPAIPTFRDLLSNGTVAAGSRLLLGYSADLQPQWGTWLQVYSSLIAGLPGSGKSTTIRYLACGVALNQGRFIVIDPHMGAGGDSLADSLAGLQGVYLCAPASDPGAVRQAIALADAHMDARIAGQEPARTPLVICVDELAAMMSNPSWQEVADLLARFLEKVAREGRKRGVFVLAGTQNVKGTRTGGTELKDAFASIFAHRNRRNQNQMLDLDPDESRLVKRLPTGAAYFVPTTGEGQVLYIPYTDADDVTRVGTLLTPGYAPADGGLPMGLPRVTSVDTARSPDVAPVAAEAERAYQLFLGNQDMAKIVLELTGVRSNQGSRYQAELARVQELVRVAARARSGEAA